MMNRRNIEMDAAKWVICEVLRKYSRKDIKVETFKFKPGRDNESKLELTFYNSENGILASTSVPFDQVDALSNPTTSDRLFFYSIDLIDIEYMKCFA